MGSRGCLSIVYVSPNALGVIDGWFASKLTPAALSFQIGLVCQYDTNARYRTDGQCCCKTGERPVDSPAVECAKELHGTGCLISDANRHRNPKTFPCVEESSCNTAIKSEEQGILCCKSSTDGSQGRPS